MTSLPSKHAFTQLALSILPNCQYCVILGPDATKDHNMTIEQEHRQVGIGTMSFEGTSESDYLWRPATGTPFHRARSSKVGEVGWGVPKNTDWNVPQSGKQIMVI